jgi:CubicO group peptidase (beta-lactamase class C family)
VTHLDPRALHRAFAVAARHVADGVAPWAVLGVATRDAVVRTAAWGTRPDGRRIGTDTVALIASITKPIVATMVLQLVAEGRLALDEPIERLLPEAAEAAAASNAAETADAVGHASPPPTTGTPSVTAWHLLTHTSGLADLDLPDLLARGTTHVDVVRRLLHEPRRSDPGTAFCYASATFDLLAALVTRLDDRPYADALRARVLEPLGMADTTFDPRATLADRVVRPISAPLPDGCPVPDTVVDGFIDLAMPGAGLWSTVGDLLRFGRAFARGGELDGVRILPRAFVTLMTREVTVHGLGAAPDPLAAEHYALGWGLPGPADPGSPGAYFHGGITGTRLWVDPGEDLVIAYLTGAWEQPAWPADAVLNAVYAALA